MDIKLHARAYRRLHDTCVADRSPHDRETRAAFDRFRAASGRRFMGEQGPQWGYLTPDGSVTTSADSAVDLWAAADSAAA